MMIVNVPIEDLDERYSKQWNEWFNKYVTSTNGHDVLTIYPTRLREGIKEGGFLDTVSTIHFKARQIQLVCQAVDSGRIPRDEKVVFLIQDGWFPIEQLAYLRDMLKCYYWKFVGIFHDGTYDKWDLTARSHMYVWGEDLENSWFKIYDKIVVGSRYHRGELAQHRKIKAFKIEVIPWHVEVPDIDTTKKENIVVFPHRLDDEKQPELFLELAQEFSNTGWKFIRTKDLKLDKQAYYQLLARSKIAVSLSLLEMFGISIVEATLLGCMPLVPDSLSYREMYRRGYRYQGISELKRMLAFWINGNLHSSPPNQVFSKDWWDYQTRKAFFPSLFKLMEEL